MIELQTVTTKAKNPSTNEFQDVTWGGINVLSTSGTTNYNNLTNKPTINGVTVQGSLTTGDLLITAADVGALPSGTKYGADFALSIDSQTFVVTAQLKDQDGNNLGQAKTIDLPLETMVVGGSYDDTTQKIILTLKNGQTVEFSVADLISGLQSEITLSNKLDADLVSDVSSENKFVTAAEKTAWNAKANASDVYTKSQTDTAIETAIGTLDVTSVGGSGKYISAIYETNGKIEATPTTFDTALSSSSTNNNAPTSKAVYDDQQRQEVEIGVVANAGAKNLFKNTAVSKTYLGVTFTVNEDGTVSLSGTATTAASVLEIGTVTPPAGSYIISGCPAGGSWAPNPNKYRIRIAKNGAWLGDETGSGYTVTVNGSDVISLQVNSGVGVDTAGLVFKPMIRHASITDSTFQPYALSNPVITPALIKQVDGGAKNLVTWDISTLRSLNPNATWTSDDTCVKGGITYKFNTDGTIVANGTADTSASRYIKLKSNFSVTNGLIASCGLPAVSQDQRKGLLQLDYPTGSDLNVYDYEESKEVNRDGTVELYISVSGGITVSNLVFRPMICTAADWAVSQKFVPYRPSWQEMADNNKIIDISSQITAESGYTVESTTHLYLQNNIVFGSIAIAKDSGSYSSSLTAVAKLPEKYAPSRQFINMCGFSTEQWSITNIGYGFIQAQNASSASQRGQISVKSPTANLNHLMLQVNYPIRLDDTL